MEENKEKELQVATSKKATWQTQKSIDRIELDVSAGNYKDLIQLLRRTLQRPGRYSHNVPVLPEKHHLVPEKWIDLVLRNGRSANITLRIRCGNLYLDGYQMQNGQWLEFKRDDGGTFHLIPDSDFLGFTGSYIDLTRVSERSLTKVKISRVLVQEAVSKLAVTTDGKLRACHLTLLIVFVCEATRFDEISSKIASALHSGPNVTVDIDDWMVVLIHSWGELSGRLLRADADGNKYFRLTKGPLRDKIKSALEAAECLGILLGALALQPTATIVMIGVSDKDVPAGQPMMELLSFQIQGFSGVLSGTINVMDGLGTQTLFNGQQSVRSGDTLSLKTLERAISAWECVIIQYNLVADGKGPKFCYTVSWDIFQITNSYATTDSDSLACGSGSSTDVSESLNCFASDTAAAAIVLNRVIFPVAWQVSWLVTIVQGDGNNQMKVYGSVVGSYTYAGKSYRVELFSRTEKNYAQVSVGGNIPMLRSITAVPFDVDLIVNIDLKDYIGQVRIAQGKATWHVSGEGPTGQFVSTIDSRVRITGNWSRLSQD